MLGDRHGPDWRFPIGASLCGVGGVGTPMPIDLFGGHTLGSVSFSAAALGVFVLGAVWMFRRWGGGTAVTLAQEESEAIWAELEEQLDADPRVVPDETEVREPV